MGLLRSSLSTITVLCCAEFQADSHWPRRAVHGKRGPQHQRLAGRLPDLTVLHASLHAMIIQICCMHRCQECSTGPRSQLLRRYAFVVQFFLTTVKTSWLDGKVRLLFLLTALSQAPPAISCCSAIMPAYVLIPPTSRLQHVVFGSVTKGMDIVKKIEG